MRDSIVIGSGIAGMTCAVRLAEAGVHVTLVSPFPAERAQSVLAAGGINAVLPDHEAGDSIRCHVEDTLRAGAFLAGEQAVAGLCEHAGEIIDYLQNIGTIFSVDMDGRLMRRAFGGQSFRRTYYGGANTGKQIVSALAMEVLRLEAAGYIQRRLWSCFHSALIHEGTCYGVLLFDESSWTLEPVYADAVVIATGGQNALFGKTTGSTQCDGYAAGKLFMQGAELKNLEFVQFHPTTLCTTQKPLLVSEAVRGEGGRLFYQDNGKRVYFLEEKYGPKGNLITRDLISREIASLGKDVFLDACPLGKKGIDQKIPEVREMCLKYLGMDMATDPIPVAPAVHFFMGGLAVHLNHETNIHNLFAVGECASMYHGANRLGGNSLLAALYSGMVAAEAIAERASTSENPARSERPDFTKQIEDERDHLQEMLGAKGSGRPLTALQVRDKVAEIMNRDMGIIRNGSSLAQGLSELDRCLAEADQIDYSGCAIPYEAYSLTGIMTLARAALACAHERRESRGAHYREDHPETLDDYGYATVISYEQGTYQVRLDQEQAYEG